MTGGQNSGPRRTAGGCPSSESPFSLGRPRVCGRGNPRTGRAARLVSAAVQTKPDVVLSTMVCLVAFWWREDGTSSSFLGPAGSHTPSHQWIRALLKTRSPAWIYFLSVRSASGGKVDLGPRPRGLTCLQDLTTWGNRSGWTGQPFHASPVVV